MMIRLPLTLRKSHPSAYLLMTAALAGVVTARTLPNLEVPGMKSLEVQMGLLLVTSPTNGTTAKSTCSLRTDKKTQTCPTLRAGATSAKSSGRAPAKLVAPLSSATPTHRCSLVDSVDGSLSAIMADLV